MKKLLLSAILASATIAPAFAQHYLLTGYESNDNIEKCDYVYTEDNLLSEIRRYYTREPESNYIVTISYDEQGREIRSGLHQDYYMTGTDDYRDYMFNAYIELTYGENNLVSERRNYNNWAALTGGEDWALGGVITYTYDDENRLVSEKTYFDAEMSNVFQEIKYEYNDKGLLEKSLIYIYSFSVATLSSMTEYSYDEEDRLIKATMYAEYPDGMRAYGSTEYEFDEDGNLHEVRDLSRSGNIQRKAVYNYPETPTPSEDVMYPYEFDERETFELFLRMINAPESQDSYGINEVTWTLDLITTYTYKYEPIISDGIFNVSADMPETISMISFIGGKLTLTGVEKGSQVQVYREDGSRVANVRYNGGNMDLTWLAKGIYIITAGNNAIKVRR